MMRLKHFKAVLKARNREFIRDRASWAWNLFFPILLIGGLAVAFGGDNRGLYKVGTFPGDIPTSPGFFSTRHIDFVSVDDPSAAKSRVERHQLDLLIDIENKLYWVNDESPGGYVVEKLMLASAVDDPSITSYNRQPVTGKTIRYVDWVVPGVLGLNMMFACLFGVGYVIVRYRKSGVLKRLKATPLRAVEFLAAQVVSRLALVIAITSVVFMGALWSLDLMMNGSYALLALIMVVGSLCLIALSLVFATHTASEELAGGLLNTVTWPMMILSGVWFSLDGAHVVVRGFANLLPLTHIVSAARAVMIDGAGITAIAGNLTYLVIFTVVCLIFGSWLFKWE